MTVSILDFVLSGQDYPAISDVARVALEAGVSDSEAALALSGAWAQVEGFTGRVYRAHDAVLVVEASGPDVIRWPRRPFPTSIMADWHDGEGWTAGHGVIVGGLVEVPHKAKWRFTATGISGSPVGDHVVQAVANLALYGLIWAPTRREFSHQSAGDTSITREPLKGSMWASGAGALLASEVVL